MQKFTYIIKTDFAMHFGPAGRLAEIARCYPDTTAIIEMGTRTANISRPMKVATMGIRKGDIVKVTAEGDSEVELIDVLYQYFEAAM
ncbi:MAG: HPr family phosphocarrier protein [Lachnospiraceae bacterium]|nr:HPr family phosphocarrier protein [Oscillospiraceae bacterium]MEE1164564.1 HPr family phosphocarrier protein [Lachnospiraceae bacterium]